MKPEEIYKKLTEHTPSAGIEFVEGAKHPVTKVQTGDDFLVLPVGKLLEIIGSLKMIDQFSFDTLSNLTAVDRLKENRFEVVYHLFSYKHRHSVTLKVYLLREDSAHLPTVENLWKGANWLEREVFDLFGIRFDGHSDLRRIMLPDDWKGHPLRKDYKEEEDYRGITTTRPSLFQ